jgi:hypothetical protein
VEALAWPLVYQAVTICHTPLSPRKTQSGPSSERNACREPANFRSAHRAQRTRFSYEAARHLHARERLSRRPYAWRPDRIRIVVAPAVRTPGVRRTSAHDAHRRWARCAAPWRMAGISASAESLAAGDLAGGGTGALRRGRRTHGAVGIAPAGRAPVHRSQPVGRESGRARSGA